MATQQAQYIENIIKLFTDPLSLLERRLRSVVRFQ